MSPCDGFDTPAPTIPRDRFGRPRVVPPGGGERKAYTRCTTFVDCLDDKYNLQQWEQRMVALGLAQRPDLLLAVSAHQGDKGELNKITGRAKEAAAASASATTGTAVHALAERIDRGQPIDYVPPDYQPDLDAYRRATAPLAMVEIETFGVLDDLSIAGTWDRVVLYAGRYYVADLKTGSTVTFGALKMSMQCAVYAHCTPYDIATDTRLPRDIEVDTERAIIIHLPAGSGTCQLYWADIAAGWVAVQVAADVRAWRARKDLLTPFTALASADTAEALDVQLRTAQTVDELRQLWTRAMAEGTWSDGHLSVALQRKAELEGAA